MWRSDLRDASVLARTELRAMRRRLFGNRRQLIATGLGLVQFAVVFPLFALSPTLAFGRQVAAGALPLGTLGAVCTATGVGGVYMGAASAINQNRVGSVGPLIRTSVPPRAVTIGRIASELVQTGVLFVPPVVVVLLIVGVGAGDPFVPFFLGVAVLSLLLAGTLLGRTVGASARYLGVLSRLSTWGKVIAFLAVMVLIFLGTQAAMQAFLPDDAPFGPAVSIPAFLPGTPLQAYASLLLAPFGGSITPTGVLASLLVLGAIPLGLAATVRIETATLLREDDGDGDDGAGVSRGVPGAFARLPATRIAWRHLLRTARDPKSLGHLLPLLFGLLGGGVYWITQPDVLLAIGPGGAVVLGAQLAGLAYCVNPLGDDRDQLPLLLSSVKSTGRLLRGRAVAGCVLGSVLAVGVGTPLAALGWSPVYAIAQTALAPVFLAASAGAALGLGGLFPKFERREYMNVERAHPSQFAILGFLFGDGILVGGGVFLLWLTTSGTLSLSVAALAWIAYVVVLLALGIGGYVYAVRRFDALTLDDV